MKKDEFIEKSLEKTVRYWILSTLRSDEFSKEHLKPENTEELEKKVDILVREITKDFITELSEGGYIENQASREEFIKILRSVINKKLKDYYESKNKNKNN